MSVFRLRPSVAVLVCLLGILPGALWAQAELDYDQYRALSWSVDRMDHMAKFEPLQGEAGMYVAIGERFGTVQVAKFDGRGVQRIWKSIPLSGVPQEVLVSDLDGDGLDDSILCRTSNGKIYVWSLDGYPLVWESLPGDYRVVTCFTTANVDADPATEIILMGDNLIHYVDGVSFNKEFTSISSYEATQIRCGDVDGDSRMEIVLNTGQVIDSVSGEIEWEDEQFFSLIELLDIDGDGLPEILTANPLGGPIKVFDGDYRAEVRFQ